MFAFRDELIHYVCERNRHVRDMVQLAKQAAVHGLEASPVATVNRWVGAFITSNPNQAALFVKRGWLKE